VHAKGGLIFLQLWHMGRQSHSSHQPGGALPVSASALAMDERWKVLAADGTKQPPEVPRALTLEEIPGVVEQYRQAAINAKAAGFDGVEVHAANGYLLDQFLQSCSNKRTDAYGGRYERMSGRSKIKSLAHDHHQQRPTTKPTHTKLATRTARASSSKSSTL
jgi:N-ethylmaleimide reductase